MNARGFPAGLPAGLLAGLVLAALVPLPGPTVAAKRQVIDRAAIIVNKKMMTQRELDGVRELQKREYQARYRGAKLEEKLGNLDRVVMKEMVESLLLEARAERLGFGVSDRELDQRVAAILKSDPRVGAIYSDQTLREYVVRDLLKRKVLNQEVNTRVVVSSKEVREACLANRDSGREVDVGHILLRGDSPEVLEKIRQIRSRLEAGANFEETALATSEDPSVKRNRGRLGFNRRGNFFKPFEEKAFALKPGQLGGPVRTRLGYHLIKVFAVRQTSRVDCDKLSAVARQRLRDRLWNVKKQARLKVYFADLRSRAEIRILGDR